jgi:hypothetical protein
MANKKSTTKKVTLVENPILPAFADSALFTVGERSEILFVYREDGKTLSKFISPEDVARAYSKLSYDTGDIPEGIIRMGYGPNGWWGIMRTPPCQVLMSFVDEDFIKVPIPGTIIFGVEKNYRIYAERDGKLFQAPFDNVYADGRICWGDNAVRPVKKAADLRAAFNLFFASPFIHRNDANNMQLTYKGMYDQLAKRKAVRFSGKLKESKVTVNSLVKIALGKEVSDD